MKPECVLHDQVNLLLLPIIGVLTTSGLLGYIDPVTVTYFFTVYIAIDFFWILAIPAAIPSLPNVILFHHIVTLTLLSFPLKYAALAPYTCWDGICEVNTFFLIARRQSKTYRKPFSFFYWITFFPLRVFLYPWMLYRFYTELTVYAAWEKATVCICQAILIGFNLMLLVLTIGNWKKKKPSSWATAASTAAAAPVSGEVIKASGKGTPTSVTQRSITAKAVPVMAT